MRIHTDTSKEYLCCNDPTHTHRCKGDKCMAWKPETKAVNELDPYDPGYVAREVPTGYGTCGLIK